MNIKPGYCACGKPLHYANKEVGGIVEKYSRERGETVEVVTLLGKFRVQRHFIALHGITAQELDLLAKAGVIERIS